MNDLKSTGVIRRIDELGRIVVPKEIRRHLGIRDGESLEIFTEDDKIILKKYSKVLEYADFSRQLCEIIPSVMDFGMFITDRDKVVSLSDNLKLEENNILLDNKMIEYIQNRECYESKSYEKLKFNELELEGYFYVQPIISSIDCLGLIILFKEHPFLKEEKQFAKFVSAMIVNKIDIS